MKASRIKLFELVNSIRTEFGKMLLGHPDDDTTFLPKSIEIETKVVIERDHDNTDKINTYVVDLSSSEKELSERSQTIKISLELNREDDNNFDDFIFPDPANGELSPVTDH